MKKLFIGLITSLLVVGIAWSEPVKRVDGRRVETYKRVTVDTIRGDASATNNGIKIDPDKDGTNEMTISDKANVAIVPARDTGDYIYLFNVADGGGVSAGAMTGGAAQKTYVFNADVNRPSGSGATGDSNDALYKGIYRNWAANDSDFVTRGINMSVRNESGGTVGLLEAGTLGANNKQGSTATSVQALDITAENYGTVSTNFNGLAIHLKNEGIKATNEYGLIISNENNSIVSAMDAAIKIQDSGANNGYSYGLDMNSATIGTADIRFNGGITLNESAADGLVMVPNRGTGTYVGMLHMDDGGDKDTPAVGSMTGGASQKTYGVYLELNRPNTSAGTGDSEDALFKGVYCNHAANDSDFIMRGINTQVGNRVNGTCGTIDNLIGSSTRGVYTTLRGLSVVSEDYYGITAGAEFAGIDVSLKCEGVDPTLGYGLRIRNLDNSTANSLNAAILIGDSGTNTGFAYGLDMGGSTIGIAALRFPDNTTQTTAGVVVESDPVVGAINGIVKANGAGVISTATADVDYLVTLAKDLVAGTGLSGGADNVFPGSDSDVTVSLDFTAVNTWTGAHSFQSAGPQITLGKDEAPATPNIAGQIKMFSAGDNAFYSTLTAGTNTSNATFTLPVDEPAGTYFMTMTVGGQMGYDATTYANSTLGNLGVVALNASLTPAVAGAVNLGSEALFFGTASLGTSLAFEGSSDDNFQTTLTAVDPTADNAINIPNAGGVMAVSATAPATLSVTGDIGITVLKDLVAGTGLTGGSNDVLPGADADITVALDLTAADTWTGIHNFQAATTAIVLGKDDATNVTGALKLWGAGATNFYTTITAGANSANADFILPTALPAATYLVNCTSGGQLGYDTTAYAPLASPTFTGTVSMPANTNQPGARHHMKFNLPDPATLYTKDAQWCIWLSTDAAIHIKSITATCDADPATEPTGDIKYADAFIGLANPAIIAAWDTTAGVFSSGAIDVAVASGKCVYLQFDIGADAAITQIAFDVTYTYD